MEDRVRVRPALQPLYEPSGS